MSGLGSFQARLLLLRCGWMVPLTEYRLRRRGFRWCRTRLERRADQLPGARALRPDPAVAQQVADLVDRAITSTSVYPAQCLTRSLVLSYYLRRFGQAPEIHLGVRTITGRFQAHAWVSCGGAVLNEPEPVEDIYQAFDWTRDGKHGVPA